MGTAGHSRAQPGTAHLKCYHSLRCLRFTQGRLAPVASLCQALSRRKGPFQELRKKEEALEEARNDSRMDGFSQSMVDIVLKSVSERVSGVDFFILSHGPNASLPGGGSFHAAKEFR